MNIETGRYILIDGELVKISENIPKIKKSTYFNTPYFSENLTDEKHPEGQMIYSKSQKREIMKKNNLEEV